MITHVCRSWIRPRRYGRAAVALTMAVLVAHGRSTMAEDPSTASVKLELGHASAGWEFYPLLPVLVNVTTTNDSNTTVGIPPLLCQNTFHWGYARPNPVFVEKFPLHFFLQQPTESDIRRRYPTVTGDFRKLSADNQSFSAIWKNGISVAPGAIEPRDFVLGWEPDVSEEEAKAQGRDSRGRLLFTEALFWSHVGPTSALFSQPGRYRLKASTFAHSVVPDGFFENGQARFRSIRFPVETNELSVEIAQPQGEDLKAYTFLLKSDLGGVFSHPSVMIDAHRRGTERGGKEKGAQLLLMADTLIRRYPDSVYASYARYLVAREKCRILWSPDGWVVNDPLGGFQMLKDLAQDDAFLLWDLAAWLLYERAREYGIKVHRPADFEEILRRGKPDYQAPADFTSAMEYAEFAREKLRRVFPEASRNSNTIPEGVGIILHGKYWVREP